MTDSHFSARCDTCAQEYRVPDASKTYACKHCEGHAVRKNVAVDFGTMVRDIEDSEDPWQALFDNARQATTNDRNGLVPFWIYPREGGAFIERRVPCLPLSRDALRLEDLRRSLAVYRMVFGQPRQDELLAFLLDRIPEGEIEKAAAEMRINLAP